MCCVPSFTEVLFLYQVGFNLSPLDYQWLLIVLSGVSG
jgi:hypothetical protein